MKICLVYSNDNDYLQCTYGIFKNNINFGNFNVYISIILNH